MTMPEELSLGEPATETAPASPFGTPNPASAEPAAPAIDPPVVSIVDTILQLNAFMSADVRRAEKTARFCSKPWLEADIDELVFELEGLVDDLGNPLPAGEHAIGEQVRTPEQVALEIQTLQAEMGAAFVSVRMAQLPSDDWQEFRTKWRKVIEGPPPYAERDVQRAHRGLGQDPDHHRRAGRAAAHYVGTRRWTRWRRQRGR
jgi:hypothetical protein